MAAEGWAEDWGEAGLAVGSFPQAAAEETGLAVEGFQRVADEDVGSVEGSRQVADEAEDSEVADWFLVAKEVVKEASGNSSPG